MAHDGASEWERVLAFWFGPLDENGLATPEYSTRWWKKDPAFDGRVRVELGLEHRAVVDGSRESWRSAPRGRLAYVIVLDQLSRNLLRGKPETFANDERALEAAREAIGHGDD